MAAKLKRLPAFLLLVLVSVQPATAMPLVVVPEETPPPIFALWLCIPFIILAALKLTYMKFRRAESIHACDPLAGTAVQDETKTPAVPSFRGLGFKIPETSRRTWLWNKDITAYLVGFLGSPAWETRIRRRVDRVVRKSKITASTVTSPRISLAEHSSVSGYTGTRTSKGTTNVSRANTTSSHHQSTHDFKRSDSRRPRSTRVSFLEMQIPELPVGDITSCGIIHSSSPPYPDPLQNVPKGSNKAGVDTKWRRRRLSMSYFSPIVMHVEPPPVPVPGDPPKQSLDKSIKSSSEESHQTRSYSKSTPYISFIRVQF